MSREKIKCPYCGHVCPVERDKTATARGLWVKCKGRNCKREFEIKIENSKDS